MNKYIDAEKLTTIIEERKAQQDQWINSYHEPINQGISQELTEILSIITFLQQEAEVKRIKENKEVQETALKYRDSVIQRIEHKRVLPSFKGELLHSFKNELHTMEQILGVKNWSDIQYALFEKFALVFAAWGGYHFHPKEIESEDSLKHEQPDNEDIDKVAQELYEHLYELKRRNSVQTNLYDKQEIIDLWKAGIEYGRNHPKKDQPECGCSEKPNDHTKLSEEQPEVDEIELDGMAIDFRNSIKPKPHTRLYYEAQIYDAYKAGFRKGINARKEE